MIPSATTTYTVTATNSYGCTATATTASVTVNGPSVNVGAALSAICQGGTSAALGGSVGGSASTGTWSDGGAGGTFTSGATSLNTTYTPPA